MMSRIRGSFLLFCLFVSACATQEEPDQQAKAGALVGSLAGAALGEKLDDETGQAVGAAVGALAGAMVGSYMDRQQRDLEQALEQERRTRQVEIQRLEDETLKLTLQSEVLFEFDSAEIRRDAQTTLRKVADHLVKYNQTAVHVIGHTDAMGAREYNLYLSERRASSVANTLNQKGVAASRIRIEGRGENQPRKPNETEEGRRLNRRVEIFVKPIVEGDEDVAYESPRY
jgi:outer membrane protein OmpA-like peptidoglycan-associated protein